MRLIPSSARLALAGAALLALAGCGDVTGPTDARESLTPTAVSLPAPISPDLLIAVVDADTRLLPALDADARAPMHAALAELRAALEAGDVTRAGRASAIVRALVAGHQGEHAAHNSIGITAGDAPKLIGADGADLSALALLADAVRSVVPRK